MQRERRLQKAPEVRRVLSEGRTWAAPLLVLKSLPNDLPHSRFSFVAGKRVGGAVVRNWVKRRLREVARQAPVRVGWDVVLIARVGAGRADYHQLAGALESLFRRAQLLEDAPPPSTSNGTEVR